jgi:RNA polymerase sigma-70 factor (ECF subfamily)
MAQPLDNAFIEEINQNLGIAHKICGIYFSDSEEGEDVLQEMMYQLWRSYPRFNARSKFSTWMYRVCLNTALTFKRKNRQGKNESLSVTHHQIAQEDSINQEPSIKMLLEAIADLSAVNKAIILLHLENMSYDEIAAITGLSKSNVSVRLVRIKKELETQLKEKIKSNEDVNF